MVKRREVISFGLIGSIAFVIDVATFNLLVHTRDPISGNVPLLASHPVTGKIISSALATLFAYFGNRNITWRGLSKHSVRREISLFFLFNVIAVGIAGIALAVSRYVLGLDSLIADNLSANVIGVGLGTLFRFWSYRKWVFNKST
ncbi:MAG TPA: GtrA family protein [Candidatus Nanopelagicaceae bacterium]|nr:GtrA family protein [Candidatus Nanopelagicaceae bacterium]